MRLSSPPSVAHRQVRFAAPDDIDRLIAFIGRHWKADHVFVKSAALFRYQYAAPDGFNFVIAEDRAGGEIDAILGFISYADELRPDICLAMWKVGERCGDPTLGMHLVEYLKTTLQPRTLSCAGINRKVIPLYQFLGFHTDTLRHYYRLNDRFEDFRIAFVPSAHRRQNIRGKDEPVFSLVRFETFAALSEVFCCGAYRDRVPYKDAGYLERRYFQHPVYSYDVCGIDTGAGVGSILVFRELAVEGAKVLRIVDFIGDQEHLRGIGGALRRLLYENRYEYVDWYLYGIADDILADAGLSLKRDDSDLIIPNHFEPFERKNVAIRFATSHTDGFFMFKADGDQDRPSVVA